MKTDNVTVAFEVMTHSNTESKKQTLEDVARQFGIRLAVEIVQ
jgi:hypothetical protein